jgi:hypothetical protein
MIINEAVISGTAAATRLINIEISRLDVREADVRKVAFEGCDIGILIVDELTRLGLKRPIVHSLQIHRLEAVETFYEPSEIKKWLDMHSVESVKAQGTKANQEALDLFERVCRTMLRQYYVKDDADDPVGAVLQNSLWRHIEKILIREDRVRRTSSKPVSGPASSFVHIVDAKSLLSGQPGDQAAARIWEGVAAL